MAVNYQPINWVNGQAPALNATNLNHMDEGIETAVEEINNIQASLTNKAEKATTLAGYGITDAYTKSYIDKLLKQ